MIKRIEHDTLLTDSWKLSSIYIVPKKLIEAFGEPDEGCCYKTQGEFAFEFEGRGFTVYDYRVDEDIKVWETDDKVKLSLGGNDASAEKIGSFMQALMDAIKNV